MVLEQQITTFFYVDDDSDDLMFFQDAMDVIGKSAKLFDVGDDMMYLLKNPPPKPSVVFLDLNMPVKNGFEILEEIRACEDFNDIPIIVYSTAYSIDVIKKCFDLRANLYVSKVTSLGILVRVMKHVLSIEWNQHTTTMQNFVYRS